MLYDTTIELSPDQPLQLGIYRVEEYPFHTHKDVLEVIFVLEGAFELTVVNNVLTMEEGDIYICSPHELHRFRALQGKKCTVLLLYINLVAYRLEFPYLDTYQFANSALEKNSAGMQVLGSYLVKWLPRFFDGPPPEPAELHTVGEEILGILIQDFQCYYMGKYYPEYNNIYRNNAVQLTRIRRIVAFIYANYNKPIRIEDVATMEHISTHHLTNILKNGCGMGFRMFLNMARVEQSAALLMEGDKSLQTIAYECGFSKQKYFDESFEKVFRMTPAQYRRKYRNSTITLRERRMPLLSAAELARLLARLRRQTEAIHLDLRLELPQEPFHKLSCVYLWGFPYDHITDFPVLRQMREDFSFSAVGIDTAFLQGFKKHTRALKMVLADFRALGVDVRVYVAWDAETQDVNACLGMLKTLRREGACGAPAFVVARAGVEDEPGRAAALQKLITGQGFAAVVEVCPLYTGKAPVPGWSYLPCLLLRRMATGNMACAGAVPLLDKHSLGPKKRRGSRALMMGGGLKTPLYHVLYLLERMGSTLIAKRENYFITQTAGRDHFQVLVYYYDKSLDPWLEAAPATGGQAASGPPAHQAGNQSVAFSIEHITGRYVLKRYRLVPEEYVHQDKMMAILDSEAVSEETLQVLNEMLGPEKALHILNLEGAYRIELELNPLEVVLLSFERL